MVSRRLRSSRPLLVLAALVVAIVALGGMNPAWTDDTELLRFSTQSPYLMILLDTSRSMNQAIGSDTPLPGGGDNPDSRIYAAKQALFSVFRDVNDVNFGFMSLDQDSAHAIGKHWLYYTRAQPSGYPNVGWPTVAAAGQDPMLWRDLDGDGIPDIDTNPNFTDNGNTNGNPADLVTFGTAFKDSSGNRITTAGTCAAPLKLGVTTDRARINAFAKTGTDAAGNPLPTTLWVLTATGNKVYRLTITRAATDLLGQTTLPIGIAADLVSDCSAPPAIGTAYTFSFVTQIDASGNHILADYLFDDNGPGGDGNGNDPSPQYWSWKDPLTTFNCADSHPFTGYGGEGNYDSGVKPSDQGITDTAFETALTSQAKFNADPFCISAGDCIYVKPVLQTTYDKRGRPLDRGDFLPWDWMTDNKAEFLSRLAPNWTGSNIPNFGVASYFADTAADANGDRRLKDAAQIPLIATGETAIAKALIDLRCWYMGTADETGNSKCRTSPFGTDFSGWRNIACNQDTGDKNYGCRKPFFIIISDGDDDSTPCKENNPTAAVSDLDQFSSVKTWYLQVGPTKSNKGCQGSGLGNSLTNAGGGQCVVINNKQDLLKTIQNILGVIREQTRAFASAAVPTVQTTSAQSIYVSNFTPLRSNATWDGHVNAFLKPLPLANGKPDTSIVCSSTVTTGCFVWDAGKVLTTTQYNATTPTDWQSKTQRRVYYPGFWQGDGSASYAGHWVTGAQLLQKATPNVTNSNVQFDLWAGLGLIGGSSMPAGSANASTWDTVRLQANTAIAGAATAAVPNPILLMKTALVQGETTPRQFLLGDIFHSDPVVIGSPVDLRYFSQNVGSDKNTANATCTPNQVASASNADHGYRCFFSRHQYRRKVLVIGHNDEMLHAFHAGVFDQNAPNPLNGGKGEFTNGTGNEIFGFMPRTVMPTAYRTTLSGATHQFSVDGSPVAADVFIDPLYANGTPVPADREWRSVIVGGLREGGRGYYALDVTQPDTLQSVTLNGNPAIIPDPAVTDSNWVPQCIGAYPPPANCGPIPYGAPLWEFNDTSSDQMPAQGVTPPQRVPMDEDDNGVPDLGATWSNPNIGRIRICTGGDCTLPANLEDRYVAIFGGGLDASNKLAPTAGTYLYMVDIERGQVIYKRKMPALDDEHPAGAIPASPAAVDTNQDGYIDRVYVATTGGYLYRIDVGADASGNYPQLKTLSNVNTTSGQEFDVMRIDPSFWQPKMIFDATLASNGVRNARPFYYRPSVFFIAKLGTYGIALGPGDREDLWTTDGLNGRFWVFVDDSAQNTASLPYTEANFTQIDVATAGTLGSQDLLVNGTPAHRGWYFILGKNERLITPGFSLFGVMFFTSYEPLTYATTDPTCDPLNPPAGGCPQIVLSCSDKKQNTTGYCSKTGTSRLFVVNATNGDGLLPPTGTQPYDRFQAIAQFVTQPFTEPGTNKNSATGGGATNNADTLSANDIAVMNIIKGLFPKDCKFANYRIDVKTIASDTSVKRIAAVPMCVISKSWKEF